MLHRIFLFAHVLSAFLYLLAHGGSVAVAHRVRWETSAERVRALLDIVLLVMARAASPYFQRSRIAVGVASADAARQGTAREPSAEELARALESGNAATMTALAVGGWAVIVWLMLFKSF